jgi:hypothetical protein
MNYGTPEYYKEGFSDYLSDIESDNPATIDNLVEGFLLAIGDWLDYHQKQADAYTELRERVRKALTV